MPNSLTFDMDSFQGARSSKHLDDYKADLIAKGNTQQHANETHALVARIVALGHIERISELAPTRVQGAIKAIRDKGRSLRTCNKALRAIKSFSRWLVSDHRAPSDALAHLKAYNADTDRRVQRRDLTDDELVRLVRAAEGAPAILGMSGPDRATAYRLAAGTGFRVGELRSLTPESFDLDADPPTVTVAAAYSKRRRNDVQPIRRDLAELLRSWLVGKTEHSPVLRLQHGRTAEMIRHDLKAAGIPYMDDVGRVADFHALRHTFITRVVGSGATVKVAQDLARHSTPTLTIGRYAHARLHDLSAALDALPDSDNPADDAADLRATGTDDEAADHDAQRHPKCHQRGNEPTRPGTIPRDEDERDDDRDSVSSGSRNPLRLTKDSDDVRRDAKRRSQKAAVGFEPTTGQAQRICNPSPWSTRARGRGAILSDLSSYRGVQPEFAAADAS